MSIVIKGMEMPTRCAECRLSTVHSFNDRPLCDVLVEYMSYGEWETKRLDNCPLVEIPPHGRLIDADALRAFAYARQKETGIACCVDALDISLAPTIIPAEESE